MNKPFLRSRAFVLLPDFVLLLVLEWSEPPSVGDRAVHGLGGSGFCPTRNQPIQDQVGGFSTHNRPVIVTNLSVRVASGWWSVSGEPDYHRNASKCGEISPDPARFCQIHPRSGEIPSDPMRFLANHDEKSLVRPDLMFIMPKIDGFK